MGSQILYYNLKKSRGVLGGIKWVFYITINAVLRIQIGGKVHLISTVGLDEAKVRKYIKIQEINESVEKVR